MSIGDFIQHLRNTVFSDETAPNKPTTQSPKQDQTPNTTPQAPSQTPKEPDIRDIKPNPRLDEGQ